MATFEELLEGLKSERLSRRIVSAWELGRFAKSAAIPVLIVALQDDDAVVRRAVESLGSVGSRLRDAAPEIVAEAVRALLTVLRGSRDRETRWEATFSLGNIRLNADIVVPALMETIADQDREIRALAAWALGQFGRSAAPAVDVLFRGLADRDKDVRYTSAESLGRIGIRDDEAVLRLTLMADDEDEHFCVRKAAARALEDLRGCPPGRRADGCPRTG